MPEQVKQMSPWEYESSGFKSKSEGIAYSDRMINEGWQIVALDANRSFSIIYTFARHWPRDELGFTDSDKHRNVEVEMLEEAVKIADGIKLEDMNMYKHADLFLYNRGWIEDNYAITVKGRIALTSYYEKKNNNEQNEKQCDLHPPR